MRKGDLVQEHDAAELQRRMVQVRQDLECNSARLKENAQTLADWRYYVRSYPWLTLTAAGATGFLLVPKRSPPATATTEAIARLARQQGLVLQPPAKAAVSTGILGGLAAMVTKTVMRAALAYAGQQASQILAARLSAQAPRAPEQAAWTAPR